MWRFTKKVALKGNRSKWKCSQELKKSNTGSEIQTECEWSYRSNSFTVGMQTLQPLQSRYMQSEEHSKGEFIYGFWWKRWGCPSRSATGKIFHIKTILKGTLWHWKHKANNVGSWSKLRNQDDNLPREREGAHSTSYHKKRTTLAKLFTTKENILILNVSNVLNYTVLYIHFPFFFISLCFYNRKQEKFLKFTIIFHTDFFFLPVAWHTGILVS